MKRTVLTILVGATLCFLAVGCNEEPPVGEVDAATGDTAVADTAGGDSGPAQDTSSEDTSPQDTSVPGDSGDDTSGGDTAPSDTATTDTGSGDTGGEDAGSTDTGAACTGPDPSGCKSNDDCASDEVCKDDPNSCDPSSCTCLDGSWACTDDCGGTVCLPKSGGSCTGPDPSGCDSNRDCASGEVCKDDPNSCDPSSCMCVNGSWACTKDCGGTVCMPRGGSCSGPDPSGCDSDRDCESGEVCKDDPNSCDPSSCMCAGGQWACTRDCGGTVCMAKSSSCTGRDPSGCDSNRDCAPGEVCKDDPNSCDPSFCSCSNGRWTCTADCNGTVCMSP